MKKLKRLKPWLKGSRLAIGLTFFYSFMATVSKLAIPFFAGKLVNMIFMYKSEACGVGCVDYGVVFRRSQPFRSVRLQPLLSGIWFHCQQSFRPGFQEPKRDFDFLGFQILNSSL